VVTEALEAAGTLTRDAADVFRAGTRDPLLYNHANDKWRGISHGQYIEAMRQVVVDYQRSLNKGAPLTADHAKELLSWIMSGNCPDRTFLRANKDALESIFKWRQGFLDSIRVAEAAKAVNDKLTPKELKALAKYIVNKETTAELTTAARQAYKSWLRMGKKAGLELLKKATKYVVPGLVALGYVQSAARGYAGDGQCGSGALGAAAEIGRDIVMAEIVEQELAPLMEEAMDTATAMITGSRSLQQAADGVASKRFGNLAPLPSTLPPPPPAPKTKGPLPSSEASWWSEFRPKDYWFNNETGKWF
jgi:hypothetical protein